MPEPEIKALALQGLGLRHSASLFLCLHARLEGGEGGKRAVGVRRLVAAAFLVRAALWALGTRPALRLAFPRGAELRALVARGALRLTFAAALTLGGIAGGTV